MPDMDGFETARRIRSALKVTLKFPRFSLLQLTGVRKPCTGKELGLDAFLIKPVMVHFI
jgi:CheY-like chemotaxis protein